MFALLASDAPLAASTADSLSEAFNSAPSQQQAVAKDSAEEREIEKDNQSSIHGAERVPHQGHVSNVSSSAMHITASDRNALVIHQDQSDSISEKISSQDVQQGLSVHWPIHSKKQESSPDSAALTLYAEPASSAHALMAKSPAVRRPPMSEGLIRKHRRAAAATKEVASISQCSNSFHDTGTRSALAEPPPLKTTPPSREPIITRSAARRLQQIEHELSSVVVSKFRITSQGSPNAAMQAMRLAASQKWSEVSDDSDPDNVNGDFKWDPNQEIRRTWTVQR